VLKQGSFMSVFTKLSNKDFEEILAYYAIGSFKKAEPILSKTSHTHYKLKTSKGFFSVTLFEGDLKTLAEPYLSLSHTLSKTGLALPDPQTTKTKALLCFFKEKAIALSTWCEGDSIIKPQPKHCVQIGEFLAKMHLSLRDYPRNLVHPKTLLRSDHIPWDHLPQGIIHGSLYREHALFQEQRLTAVLHFYFASTAALAYDLAISAQDWCRTEQGFDPLLLQSLLDAYHSYRPFTLEENKAWPELLEIAAQNCKHIPMIVQYA
jgi:homoserine kinase type II